jgi:hypothetical protein
MQGDDWDVGDGFDLDAFLSQPLVARLATSHASGPRVRPVWYQFDDRAFWWITGQWSGLEEVLRRDPRVELVVDTCDLETGTVLQVRARGRAQRWGERYLGSDKNRWGRFASSVFEDPSSRLVFMRPTWLRARDLSWR